MREVKQRSAVPLFAAETLDIDTDITALEGMLKREGLAGGDFDTL